MSNRPVQLGDPLDTVMIKAAAAEVGRKLQLEGVDLPTLFEAIRMVNEDSLAYRPKLVAKKRGHGTRRVDAPAEPLKTVQRCIHHIFLKPRYLPTDICHSFIGERYNILELFGRRWLPGRTIVSSAYAHLGVPPDKDPDLDKEEIGWRIPRSLFSVDLKDAYPSISAPRILQIYQELIGDRWSATILAHLSTWRGCLPQGAPTSPLLFNFACRELDEELMAAFSKEPFCVTRYADDITVTSTRKGISPRTQQKLVRLVERHGFTINPEKICYWQDHKHVLRITGINLKPWERSVALSVAAVDRLRAVIHRCTRVLQGSAFQRALLGSVTREETTSIVRELNSIERRALGRICGAVGLYMLVYGETELPTRLYNWVPSYEATGFGLKELVAFAKRNPVAADISWASREVYSS